MVCVLIYAHDAIVDLWKYREFMYVEMYEKIMVLKVSDW